MKKCIRCHDVVDDQWKCQACGFQVSSQDGCLILAPEFKVDEHGYDAAAYKVYSNLERGHFWFESRIALIIMMFKRHFPTARKFMEIGCGTGFVLSAIEESICNLQVTGSEILVEGLELARENTTDARFYQMDARAIPFDAEFDVIGAFDVLEHIQEDEVVLAAMYKAIRPGGGILVTVPQHPFMWSEADDYAMHQRRYQRNELHRKVEAAGFEVTLITSFVSVLFPLMLYSRWRQKRNSQPYDPSSELTINPLANKVFKAVMTVERFIISVGVRFPFGGSLLLVGTKSK